MSRRSYSDEEKAQALAVLDANGGNISLTANQLGIPISTLHGWSQGRGTHEAVTQLRKGKREKLSDELEAIAYLLIDSLPEKTDGATLQQAATSLGIVIDKMQLLRGKATEIIEDASLTDTERAERITALLERARARRVGQPDSNVRH